MTTDMSSHLQCCMCPRPAMIEGTHSGDVFHGKFCSICASPALLYARDLKCLPVRQQYKFGHHICLFCDKHVATTEDILTVFKVQCHWLCFAKYVSEHKRSFPTRPASIPRTP